MLPNTSFECIILGYVTIWMNSMFVNYTKISSFIFECHPDIEIAFGNCIFLLFDKGNNDIDKTIKIQNDN